MYLSFSISPSNCNFVFSQCISIHPSISLQTSPLSRTPRYALPVEARSTSRVYAAHIQHPLRFTAVRSERIQLIGSKDGTSHEHSEGWKHESEQLIRIASSFIKSASRSYNNLSHCQSEASTRRQSDTYRTCRVRKLRTTVVFPYPGVNSPLRFSPPSVKPAAVLFAFHLTCASTGIISSCTDRSRALFNVFTGGLQALLQSTRFSIPSPAKVGFFSNSTWTTTIVTYAHGLSCNSGVRECNGNAQRERWAQFTRPIPKPKKRLGALRPRVCLFQLFTMRSESMVHLSSRRLVHRLRFCRDLPFPCPLACCLPPTLISQPPHRKHSHRTAAGDCLSAVSTQAERTEGNPAALVYC
jgi:hypothetical protein